MRTAAEMIAVVVCATALALTRLRNPDMTETRLFLTFWPLYLIIVLVLMAVVWVTQRHER